METTVPVPIAETASLEIDSFFFRIDSSHRLIVVSIKCPTGIVGVRIVTPWTDGFTAFISADAGNDPTLENIRNGE